MSMPPDQRERLLKSTREAAAAFLMDVEYLRDINAKQNHSVGELRRLSGVLRRLLIDRDITNVAAPQLGKFMFTIPDNQPIYEKSEGSPFTFFQSGGAKVFGVNTRPMIVEGTALSRPMPNFDADRTARARIDTFLSQRVLCLQGVWITREDVIKYVAYVASGVHSGSAISDVDKAMAHIRKGMTYTMKENNMLLCQFDISDERDLSSPPDFQYTPNTLDPVFIELLSAVYFLLKSDDVLRLESTIKAELGVP